MYEYAEEIDSICSSQNIVGPLGDKKPSSNSEFPYEVELRFQTDLENDHQRAIRLTTQVERQFNGNSTNLNNDRNQSLQYSTRKENELGNSNTNSKNRKISCRKFPFLQHMLCVDCC